MLFLLLTTLVASVSAQCPDGTKLTFTKTSGFQPKLPARPLLLYSSSYGYSITAECYNRCRVADNCVGFILVYAQSTCFRVESSPDTGTELISSPGVSYFAKACLPVPESCMDRAWSIETVPGYELLAPKNIVLQNSQTREQCMGSCLNGSEGNICFSANYNSLSKSCTLFFSSNRWISPDLFVATMNSDSEYIENTCKKSDGRVCWQNPVFNKTSLRADLQFFNMSLSECENRCLTEVYFECRAISYFPLSQQCFFHSDTALNPIGPEVFPQLEPGQGAEYVETIPCLNLTVTCTKDEMNVTLFSPKFKGLLSVQGHPLCGITGKGRDVTTLTLQLSEEEQSKCNVNVAYSLSPELNKTLFSTVVVVQYHELIQRAGDRVVKANCLLSEGERVPNNITVAANFNIGLPPVQNEVSGGDEIDEVVPKARMYVLDGRNGSVVNDVKLGDPLILRIDVDPPYDVSYVRAGHLIASSGDGLESLLLLDWAGCPPNPAVFPGLVRTGNNTLEAKFSSFRFQSSPQLSLGVVLTFSKTPVQPVDCGNGVQSVGRRKRATEIVEELPLQLSITVHSEENTMPNNIIQASYGGFVEETGERLICTTFLTAALIALFLVLLQCTILTVFCVAVRRIARNKQEDRVSLRRDFDKRVTFSDDFPSLRLSTPMS